MKRIIRVSLIWMACTTSAALADDGCQCCNRCGCSAQCCKVCRCVPDVKKVTKTEYCCECEDFCVPGPSERSVVCDECGKRKHVYTPTCAEVRTRKKLVKHETVTEVPTYKWVVEYICPHCASQEPCNSAPAEQTSRATTHGGAEARQVTYESPVRVEPVPAEADAAPSSSGGNFKSQVRRFFDPLLSRAQSDR